MRLKAWKTNVGTSILIFAIFAYSIVSAVIAFTYQETADNHFPIGTQTVFRVNEIAPDKPKSEVINTIHSLAVSHELNIYKMTPDPEHIDGGRVLFVFLGDESTFIGDSETWEYPSFSRSFSTRLLPHTEITTQDIRGLYAASIDAESFAPLLNALERAGVSASLEPVPHSMIFANILFGETSSGPLLIAILLALFLAAAFYASRRHIVCSIRYIHGRNRFAAVLAEYWTTVRVFSSIILVCGAAAIAGLYIYNGLTQAVTYFSTLGLLLLGGAAAVLAGQTVTLLIMDRWATSEIIKGRKPLVFLATASVAAQIITLAISYPTISTGVHTATSIIRDARFDAHWLAARSFVTVRFSGTNTPADFEAISARFGELARSEEQNGRLVVSAPAAAGPQEAEGYGPYTGNSLVVNNRYLSEQNVLSSQGERIEKLPEKDGKMYVLIPRHLKAQVPAIVGEYREWAVFQRSLDHSASTDPASPEITVIETATGQEIFSYGSDSTQTQISKTDPVVAVVPARSGILSNNFYLSAASTGSILFTDAAALKGALSDAKIEQQVSSIDSVSDRALVERNSRIVKATILTASLILFATMLLIVGIVLTRVYFDRNRQRLFVEGVHGRAFIAMHGEYLLVTGLIAGGVLAVEVLLRAVTSLPGFYLCLLAAALFMLTTIALTGRHQKALYERFAR